jgi:integration host factor subunit alpha
MSKTLPALTRADLADAVNSKLGFSLNDCAQMIEQMFEHVSGALEAGETVKIVGFGAFGLRTKAARMGRNPKTKVEAVIAARRVVNFRPSAQLKNVMNDNKRKKI